MTSVIFLREISKQDLEVECKLEAEPGIEVEVAEPEVEVFRIEE